jgi:hypothetical protein
VSDSELVPIENITDLLDPFAHNCFVAIDLADGRRIVGTLVGLRAGRISGDTLLELELPNGAHTTEAFLAVQTAFWAPMGYRAPAVRKYVRR